MCVNHPFASRPPVITFEQPEAHETRLHGGWLLLARSAWIAVTVFTIIHLAVGIPLAFAQLQTVCNTAGCLTPAIVQGLHAIGLSVDFFALSIIALQLIFTLTSLAVGLVTFDRTAVGLFAWPLLVSFLLFFGNISPILSFYLFPDGRFVPRWTRILAVVLLVAGVGRFFFSDTSFYHWFSPFSFVLFVLSLAVGVFAQVYRYRRVSGPVQRQQTKWIMFGITVAVVGSQVAQLVLPRLGLPVILLELVGNTIYYLSLLLLPLTIGIAILRYRLWEINLLIKRTLVYGILTVSVVSIYILVVGSLSALFQTRSNLLISLIATGLVAVLFQPLRTRLQRSVNRLIYGERDDPYAVLSHLGQRLEATLAPGAVLPTIVETVAQALKLPYAAISMKGHEQFIIAASYGEPASDPIRLPLVYQTEQVGELVLAPRAPDESFSAADKRLLNDLTHQIGVAD